LQAKPELKATTSTSIRKRSAAQQEGGSVDTEAKRIRDGTAGSASSATVAASPPGPTIAATPAEDDDRIIFFERSVLSDKYCFAANCRASGLVSKQRLRAAVCASHLSSNSSVEIWSFLCAAVQFQEVEWRVYCDWWSFVMHEFRALRIDGLVYLRCTPATCHSRLQKRARSEEAGVPLDYLCDLHRRHEQWLIGRSYGQQFPIPTLVLNTDEEFEAEPSRRASMVAKIKAFVKQLATANGARAAIASPAASSSSSASSASASASSAAATEPVLARRLSSGDGVELLGELTDVKMMRVGADGLAMPAGDEDDEDDEDGVPTGPVVESGDSAASAADAASAGLGGNNSLDDDDDDDDEGAAAAASTASPSRSKSKGVAVVARKQSGKASKGITDFFGKAK
jgi:hypothetical protein